MREHVTNDQHLDTRAIEDELLAVRCQLGERDAFDRLIDRWYQPLWRYARRMTGSDDVASDVRAGRVAARATRHRAPA